jgi:monoamine oxidase
MERNSVIIIGAGAAGLMAARALAKAGKQVEVLEARNRCGGRIHTLNNEQSFKHVELGAEFIHGDLPVTLQLLNEANISYYPSGGEMWQFRNGKFITDDDSFLDWGELMQKLSDLQEDCTIYEFLQREFAGDENRELRNSVERFASGYDTADPKKGSVFALRNEWEHEADNAQHRVSGGYAAMIDYLAEDIKANGGSIHLNTPVSHINWEPDNVVVEAVDGTQFDAAKVLIALPLGILQANTVSFHPQISEYSKALHEIGFGAIIKVLFEFKEPFWEDDYSAGLVGKSMKDMGFIISDQPIPTWWTQEPLSTPVLTGWLGGPPAFAMKDMSTEELHELSLQSVAAIFSREVGWLTDNLVAYSIQNWTNEPYTLGSYAYDMVGSRNARKLLAVPIKDTIYLAGEYLYEGAAMGTVEAALTSGQAAATAILAK